MKNLLLERVEYKVDETGFGVWRRFVYPNGQLFEEFVSHSTVLGLPFLHYTRGTSPETGKRIVATGFIAIGRLARGVIAIGHAALGGVALGQAAVGLIALGQASLGLLCVGQLAIALVFGLGQVATGQVAIGQLAVGEYVLAQEGWGRHVWDTDGASLEAREYFEGLLERVAR